MFSTELLIALNKITADIGVEYVGDSSLVVNSTISVVTGGHCGRVLSVGDGFTIGSGIMSVIVAIGFA